LRWPEADGLDGRLLPSFPVLSVVSKPVFFSGLDDREFGEGGTGSEGREMGSWWKLVLPEGARLADRDVSLEELFFDAIPGRAGRGGARFDRSGYCTAGIVPCPPCALSDSDDCLGVRTGPDRLDGGPSGEPSLFPLLIS
jgi:hypothetical protein